MKLKALVIVMLLLIPTLVISADMGSARISLLKGDVQITSEDENDYVAAATNTPLYEGDRVWSPAGGRAEIQIPGGISVRISSDTALDFLTLAEQGLQLHLAKGHAYINNRLGGIEHIQIDTPLTSVSGYDNSIIRIDVADDGGTAVSIIKGYSHAETANGRVRINAGNTLHLAADFTAELAPLSAPDKWERWNEKRDRILSEAGESLRYLPDELDDYANDMNSAGQWVYVSEYGYCWTPSAALSVDWSPYRLGRWVWRHGNYVWVSTEPWGWAPYHYGRWAYAAGTGWCWIPPRRGEAHWGPGYVGWVHTDDRVAWVPLAPGEQYYGYGNYGPGSINISVTTIDRRTINHRNLGVNNAVIVVNRNDFLTGKQFRPLREKRNPFQEMKTNPSVAVGPLAVRPDRRGTMPAIKKLPETVRPPERVRNLQPARVREERRLRPSETESAFKPDRPAVNMPVREMTVPRQQQPRPAQPQRQRDIRRGTNEQKPVTVTAPPAVQRPAGSTTVPSPRPAQTAPVTTPPKPAMVVPAPAATPVSPPAQRPPEPRTQRTAPQQHQNIQPVPPPAPREETPRPTPSPRQQEREERGR